MWIIPGRCMTPSCLREALPIDELRCLWQPCFPGQESQSCHRAGSRGLGVPEEGEELNESDVDRASHSAGSQPAKAARQASQRSCHTSAGDGNRDKTYWPGCSGDSSTRQAPPMCRNSCPQIVLPDRVTATRFCSPAGVDHLQLFKNSASFARPADEAAPRSRLTLSSSVSQERRSNAPKQRRRKRR
ncbi:hypothetical protein VTI74DRAFT_2731 [Chaetomium olivicolor]